MKLTKLSFLFFFILSINEGAAQQQKDSVTHYHYLIANPSNSDDLFKGYKFFKKHKELSKKVGDTIYVIYDYWYLMNLEYKFGQLHESESTGIEALEFIKNLELTDMVLNSKIGIYNQLGIIQKDLGNYSRAIEYYNKILGLTNDSLNRNKILNNRANALLKMKNYGEALREFELVYQNSLSIDNALHKAMVLDNLGFTKSKLNRPGGLSDMLESLNVRIKEGKLSGIYVSYIHLAEYYLDRNMRSKVRFYANKALGIAEKLNNTEDIIKSISFLNEVNDFSNMKRYAQLLDSISTVNQLNENKFASIKYDYLEEKNKLNETRTALAESSLLEEKQRKRVLIIGLISIFGFIISSLMYVLMKSKHKKEKLEKVYETESRISKRVHDEVANDVYQMMTKIQNIEVSNSEVLDGLEHIYEKTRDISRENTSIDLDAPFNIVLDKLHSTYKNRDTNIITKGLNEVDWKVISGPKKKIVYRVLQELLTNMKKHSNAKIVLLEFSKTKNKLHINYKDNGIGCVLNKTGGLLNAESRIKVLNGSITFESEVNNGFKAYIII